MRSEDEELAGRHASPAVAPPAPKPGQGRQITVPPAPRAPIQAMAAKVMALRAARRLPFSITVPGGESTGNADSEGPELRLRRPDTFYRRLGAGGLIGFGEAFQAGDWDSNDLPGAGGPPAKVVQRPPASSTISWTAA